jgi:hypothetical protein
VERLLAERWELVDRSCGAKAVLVTSFTGLVAVDVAEAGVRGACGRRGPEIALGEVLGDSTVEGVHCATWLG